MDVCIDEGDKEIRQEEMSDLEKVTNLGWVAFKRNELWAGSCLLAYEYSNTHAVQPFRYLSQHSWNADLHQGTFR